MIVERVGDVEEQRELTTGAVMAEIDARRQLAAAVETKILQFVHRDRGIGRKWWAGQIHRGLHKACGQRPLEHLVPLLAFQIVVRRCVTDRTRRDEKRAGEDGGVEADLSRVREKTDAPAQVDALDLAVRAIADKGRPLDGDASADRHDDPPGLVLTTGAVEEAKGPGGVCTGAPGLMQTRSIQTRCLNRSNWMQQQVRGAPGLLA